MIPAMSIMSDAIYEPEPEPYDVPRGTCPECGSGAVKHFVIGYLVHPEAMETAPVRGRRSRFARPASPSTG